MKHKRFDLSANKNVLDCYLNDNSIVVVSASGEKNYIPCTKENKKMILDKIERQLNDMHILKVNAEKKDSLFWGCAELFVCIVNLISIFFGINTPFLIMCRVFITVYEANSFTKNLKTFIKCKIIEKRYEKGWDFIYKLRSIDFDLNKNFMFDIDKKTEAMIRTSYLCITETKEEKTTDNFGGDVEDELLKSILQTKNEIQQKNIGEPLKKELIDKLVELGICYMEKLQSYRTDAGLTNFYDYKLQLRNECIKMIVDIEHYANECEQNSFEQPKMENEIENFIRKMKY